MPVNSRTLSSARAASRSGVSSGGLSPSKKADTSFHPPARQCVEAAMRATIEQKAHDTVGLQLTGLTDIADYFVIASGTSDTHVRGIADRVQRDLKEVGERPLTVSGYDRSEWILLDYGDFVVHVFYEPTRQFYNLDGLWKEASRLPLSDELKLQADRLRTGMY